MSLPTSNNGKQKIRSVNIYMAEPMGRDWGGGGLVGGKAGGLGEGVGIGRGYPIVTYKNLNILIFSFKLLLT